MFGDQHGVLISRTRISVLYRLCQPSVPFGAVRFELGFVGHCMDQRMVEHILGLLCEPDLIDELGRQQVRDRRFDPEHLKQAEAEPRADDRRCAQCAFCFRAQSVDAGGDGRLQRGRHTHLGTVCRRDVCARLPFHHTTLGDFTHDFLGEERVTGGPLGDRLAQCTNRGVRPEQL